MQRGPGPVEPVATHEQQGQAPTPLLELEHALTNVAGSLMGISGNILKDAWLKKQSNTEPAAQHPDS